MKLITGKFEKKLRLQFASSIRAGFPSPAEDYLGESLDFNHDFSIARTISQIIISLKSLLQ